MVIDFNGKLKVIFKLTRAIRVPCNLSARAEHHFKPRLIFLFSGNVDHNLDFTFGEGTSFYDSCGATLNGEFWVFGGNSNQRQLRKVFNASLNY